MKPALFCLFLFSCVLPMQLMAQEQSLPEEEPELLKHEISFGYGVLGTPAVSSVITDVFTFFIFSQDIERQFTGPAILGYHYRLSQKVSLGLTTSYTNFKIIYKDTGELASQIEYYALLPRFSYYWAKKPKVEVYSGIGLGACFLDKNSGYGTDNRDEVILMTQVTFLGLRAGKKTGLFMEMGLGMNGLLNAGIDRRF